MGDSRASIVSQMDEEESESTESFDLDDFREKYYTGSNFDPPRHWTGNMADQGLNLETSFQAWLEETGYGKPEVLDEKAFNKAAKGSDVIYRGVQALEGISAEFMHDQYLYADKYYSGLGIYGDGMYFSNVKKTATEYAGFPWGLDGAVIKAALKPGSKTIPFREAYEGMQKDTGYYFHDMGALSAWAQSRGYDAITQSFGKETYYNVLNRNAMIMSNEYIYR